MDNDKLLRAIYNKPALWDRNSEAYYNRDLKVMLWKEVVQEMGSNYEIVKHSLKEIKNCLLSKPNLRHDILCFEYALAAKELFLGKSKTTFHTSKRKLDTKKDKELPEKIKVQIIEAIFEDDRDDYYSCEYSTRPSRAITYT